MQTTFDVVLLTDHRYLNDSYPDQYSNNVIKEDTLVKEALEKQGLNVWRTNWDNPSFDWGTTRSILFRTTWDYFDRFPEFSKWLDTVANRTKLINPMEMIRWNMDKHYLSDLRRNGVPIVPTYFIEAGDKRTLAECLRDSGWSSVILKPAISGAARHTYKLNSETTDALESIFSQLIKNEAMLIQPFMESILTKGEVAHMVMGGKHTHSVLKIAKAGDFRVQDDFGGTVHEYRPNSTEIEFIESVMKNVDPTPAYGRVDVIWDNEDKLVVSELELIEPELWFRKNHDAANLLAKEIVKYLN
jgi:hypothetical protein